MEIYKTRKINFKNNIKVDDWDVKVYTISKTEYFDYEMLYDNAISKLPVWFNCKNGFENSNDNIAFMILHWGTEGIFILVNWWVGKNMLNTNIYFSKNDSLNQFKKISGKGLAPCVWELEIINHERISWTTNVLKKSDPDFNAYLQDVINIEL